MADGVEFDPLGVGLANIERAWHPTLLNEGDSWGAVDIDVSPDFDNPYSFNDTGEAKEALDKLSEEAQKAGGEQDVDFIREKIRAHLMYIRVASGEDVSIAEHIETAMGTSPEMIDEDIIDMHRDALDRQLRDAPVSQRLRYGSEHAANLRNELTISDTSRLRRELEQCNRWSTDFILRRTAITPVDIDPEIVEEDVFWSGHLGTKDKRFSYRTNVHPRHEYTLGRIWANAPHERTHITQFEGLYKPAIMLGNMSVSTGVTSLHAPENTQAEFNAQAVEQMALRELGISDRDEAWQYRFEADYHFYSDMVWNNAHIMINSGVNQEMVVKYVEERLLLDTNENIVGSLETRRDDPTMRGYLGGAYWPSLVVGMEMIKPGHLKNPEGDQPEPEDLQNLQKAVFALTMRRPVRLKDIKDKITKETSS